MLEHLRFQVLEHHVCVTQAVVRSHTLHVALSCTLVTPSDFPVEGHDGTEGVTFWNQSKLSWGLSIHFAEGLHFLLLD